MPVDINYVGSTRRVLGNILNTSPHAATSSRCVPTRARSLPCASPRIASSTPAATSRMSATNINWSASIHPKLHFSHGISNRPAPGTVIRASSSISPWTTIDYGGSGSQTQVSGRQESLVFLICNLDWKLFSQNIAFSDPRNCFPFIFNFQAILQTAQAGLDIFKNLFSWPWESIQVSARTV